MFLTPFRGDFETESKRKKIPENIFYGTEEDRGAWEIRQGSPRGPTSPHPYGGLPSVHASLLTDNLASMKEAGKLDFVKNNYLKADEPSTTHVKHDHDHVTKDPIPPKAKDPMVIAVKEAVSKATTGMPRVRPSEPSSACTLASNCGTGRRRACYCNKITSNDARNRSVA
ncbi:hypothetical protein ZWY2020_008179 [Hordeum vulgare]|nr:hypothetical protein ZWY2020_008179 [Hordeum vulgare]